ncbi:MAG TPA: DUF488 domain-containing protein [Hyphomicrobiales bacterium]|nr:DUF488 domain-containing protein [Hyphomicrobiales bacterium]
MPVFYTIGHSNRAIGEFIRLLQDVHVKLLIDVRTIPKSRHNPQFNAAALEASLNAASIAYKRIAELGGLRSAAKGQSRSVNAFWENESFHNYADYAATPSFRKGLEELLGLGRREACAIMCAEAVWWRCHRRIISDYLLAAGETVMHIMGEGKIEPAQMTPAAIVGADGIITYPGAQGQLFV